MVHSGASPSRPVSEGNRSQILADQWLPPSETGYSASTGVGRFVLIVFVVWALAIPIAVGAAAAVPMLGGLALVAFACLTFVLLACVARVLLAKGQVLARKELHLFFGLAKFIAWDPTEAVLILKNKLVSYVDDNLYDGGGVKLIYPVLGDELVCRAPLEIQTISFQDHDVLTREYLPLIVHGTMKWRITNIQRFYLLVSKEIQNVTDKNRVLSADQRSDPMSSHSSTTATLKLDAVDQWLRFMAEEQTRTAVSRVNSGLLIAERVAADLPSEIRDQVKPNLSTLEPSAPSSAGEYRSATDGLAAAIHETVIPRVKEFGIDIHDVTLQEVRLPPHIHEAAVEACKAAYLPLIAQKQAIARKMQLQAEADVLGAETVGAREVVGSAPPFALVDFLSTFLTNNRALLETRAKQDGTKMLK